MRSTMLMCALATATLAGCAQVQKAQDAVTDALASPGAQMAFTATCDGVELLLGTAQTVPVSADTAVGLSVASSIVKTACGGAAPTTAAELEVRLGKIVVEQGWVQAVIAKALGK